MTQNNRNVNTTTENYRYISIPYIRRASERIGEILHEHGINLGHKQANTLRSELCRVKDKREPMDRNGLIYSIKCKDCQAEYIGETEKN